MEINLGEKESGEIVLKKTILRFISLFFIFGIIYLIHGMNVLFYLLNIKGLIILGELIFFFTLSECIIHKMMDKPKKS